MVCVIAAGAAWHFKGYKYSDVATLFDKGESPQRNSALQLGADLVVPQFTVLGIYFYLDGDPTDPAIQNWNVKKLSVSSRNLLISLPIQLPRRSASMSATRTRLLCCNSGDWWTTTSSPITPNSPNLASQQTSKDQILSC